MTTRDDLVNHPHAFLRHNILMLDGTLNNPTGAQLQGNNTVLLKLEDFTPYYQLTRVRNRKGFAKLNNWIHDTVQTKATNFYVVSAAAPTDPETFSAYICPYAQDNALSITLGSATNLMFTAEMSGCSFGIGMPNAHGDVFVMHSNQAALATPTSTAPQEGAQLQDLQNNHANARMLLPGAYRQFDAANAIDYRATTVGIRSHGKWEFWYQNFNTGMGDKHMVSVTKIH